MAAYSDETGLLHVLLFCVNAYADLQWHSNLTWHTEENALRKTHTWNALVPVGDGLSHNDDMRLW